MSVVLDEGRCPGCGKFVEKHQVLCFRCADKRLADAFPKFREEPPIRANSKVTP